ncbi:hypothetical protein CA850_17175 [Micromonospora echinospora]|uniref:DUF3263 domain-containing protein n=1 Tax=Micromonospora echinospora TaxID=1877 RepID=A0A1C4WWC0_MICEC|nr:DUF3263 domain-containing protein [Micromonospora echinospora]OZV79777.1 hypothetical protein CA850_17175 [Micromonospora echinospora]SCF00557.1 Protein of unknown function [Micromonospora echinospora]
MQPSADAFPGRADRTEQASSARGVPPPRSAPEVESAPSAPESASEVPAAQPAPADAEHGTAQPAVRDPAVGIAQVASDPAAGEAPAPLSDDQAVPPARDAGGTAPADGLTERERGILAFERHWWRHAGAKEQAIRDTFGLSATRYYQLLNALLDNPAALAADPLLVGRLRRLRSSRARNRRR